MKEILELVILLYALACAFHLPALDRPARWCAFCHLTGLLRHEIGGDHNDD